MQRSLWRGSFDVTELPAWLAFYRSLRDRRRGAYARFYAPVVEELERIERQVRPTS